MRGSAAAVTAVTQTKPEVRGSAAKPEVPPQKVPAMRGLAAATTAAAQAKPAVRGSEAKPGGDMIEGSPIVEWPL